MTTDTLIKIAKGANPKNNLSCAEKLPEMREVIIHAIKNRIIVSANQLTNILVFVSDRLIDNYPFYSIAKLKEYFNPIITNFKQYQP